MPRTADHAARRLQIVEAVCRLTLEGGLPRATFRQIAAEAGVSVRLVQYYFGTKDQLLLAVQLHVGDRSTARMMRLVEETDGSPQATLRALLFSFIPTDDDSRVAMLLYASLHTEWIIDPSTAPDDAHDLPKLGRAVIVDQLGKAQLADDIDIDAEAMILMTLVTGHSLYVLDGMYTAEEAQQSIDYQLTRIFR